MAKSCFILSSLLALAALAGGCATTGSGADQTYAAAAKTAESTTGDPNEVVCKTIKEPGSRIRGREYCMTRAAWDEQEKRDRRQMRQALDDKAAADPH